jgi:hypothetical protein
VSTSGNQNANSLTEALNAAVIPVYKIRFAVKLLAFIAATIALSWFFEGWREINDGPTFLHWAVLLGGTTSTLLVVGLMAYWTYFEAKSKGTLKKRVALFERIRENLAQRSKQNGLQKISVARTRELETGEKS